MMPIQTKLTLIFLLLASLACGLEVVTPIAPLPTLTPFPTNTPIPATPTPVITPTLTPTPELNSPSGPPLISLHMFNLSEGWGILDNQLLVTSDGCLTWAGVPVPGGFKGSDGVYFQSVSTAYILSPAADGSGGTLNFTTNRGQTWETFPVPMANGQIQFMKNTDQEGFVLEDLGVAAGSMKVAVYQTLNRLHWDQTFVNNPDDPQETDLPFAGTKAGMYFINNTTGWVSGSEPVENFIYVFRTGDAGRTWYQAELTPPAELTSFMAEARPPFFFDGVQGYLPVFFTPTAGDPLTIFYYSPDAGGSWAATTALPRIAIYDFVDTNTGWAWGDRKLYATTDAAATWHILPMSISPRESVTQLDFIDANNGWVITVDENARVYLYRTTDGGATWSAIFH